MRGAIGWAPSVAGAVLISSSMAVAAASGVTGAPETWVNDGPGDVRVVDGYDLTRVLSDKGVWYTSFTPEPDGGSFLAIATVSGGDDWRTWRPSVVRLAPGKRGRLRPAEILDFGRLRDPGLWSDGVDVEDASIGEGPGNGGAGRISLAPDGDLLIAAGASKGGTRTDQALVELAPDGSLQKVASSADLVAEDVFGKPVVAPWVVATAVANDRLYGRAEGWDGASDTFQRLVQIIDPDSDGDWSDRVIQPIVLPDSVPAVEDGVYDWSYGGFVQLPADQATDGVSGAVSVLLPVSSRSEYRLYRLTDVGDDGVFTAPGEAELVFSRQVEPGSLDPNLPPQLAVIGSPSGLAFVLAGLTNPSRVSITQDGVARDVVRGLFAPSSLVALADGSILIGTQDESSGGPARQPYSILRLVADDASTRAPAAVVTQDGTPAMRRPAPGRQIIPRAPLTPDVPRAAVWLWAAAKSGTDAEMLLLYGADGSGPRDALPGIGELWSPPCGSADGSAVAVWAEVDVPNEHALYLFDTSRAGPPVMVTERSGTIFCPFPSGALAIHDPAPSLALSRLSLDDGHEVVPLVETKSGLCPSVTDDGRFLAVATGEGMTSLSIVDVVDGSVRLLAEGLDGALVRSAWTPDGSRLAIVTGPYEPMQAETSVTGTFEVAVVDVAAGNPPRPVFSLEGPAPSVAWSPDGRLLAVLGREREAECGCERVGTLTIVDTLTDATRVVATDATFAEWSPADPGTFAWGDRATLTIETDGVARTVDAPMVRTDDGRKPASWTGFMGWSPDGRYLGFGIPRLMTVDTTNDRTRVILSETDDLTMITTEWWR